MIALVDEGCRMARSSAALIGAAAMGDEDAFATLYERHKRHFFAVALRITRDAALASDALQEGFLQIWQNAGRFDPGQGEAEPWMLATVRYRAIDLLRRRPGAETASLSEDAVVAEAEALPDLRVVAAQGGQGAALARCLEALPPERARLIVAAFVEGYSQSELAARSDTPLGTVKAWIRRGLAGLRACLDGGRG